ncbi:MAG: DUF2306 domain-containing protein [Arcicella sp.]|jgi:uncharacterized membrane protein|nr:DUF2306 domain-containing protein [Arcicella sp.]
MNTLVGSNIGLTHLLSGVIALILGGMVLILKKGTALHRKIGYAYVFSMIVLIVSSFLIYRLFGKFGVFHVFSLIATFSLLAGMLPMLKKKRTAKDLETHFKRMYWSVAGLYAAFAAESFVRIPKFGTFWQMVAWSFVLVFVICFAYFIKMKPVWSKKFGKDRTTE